MVNLVTKPREAEKRWVVYKHKDGSRDKLYEPGWAGTLDDAEVERLQQALATDRDLARWWGWRPRMKRRAVAAIERVASHGDPDNRAHNVKLVREFSKKGQQGNESLSARVKKSVDPGSARPPGRRKVESWEAEMLRLAGTGLGVHKIAKALQAQGVDISGPTVSTRLRELRGQLRLIS
ncbi:MAG TPA: hypothetical protein VFA32_24510 [Dehalococcoidia bacterium]|nr:hypothetical protein [Dehalococcoidia bacterium]